MTRESEEIARESKVVVAFDICSSTAILEDLLLTGNEKIWRDLLIGLEQKLQEQKQADILLPYKFTGDGWILLFPREIKGTRLIDYLEELSESFDVLFRVYVRPHLQITNKTGLTFGVDLGQLLRLEMMEKVEYVGRALNIACRLQGSLAAIDPSPAYKVLFSSTAFSSLGVKTSLRASQPVTASLRNVMSGEGLQCVKVDLIQAEKAVEAPAAPPPRKVGSRVSVYTLKQDFDRQRLAALISHFKSAVKRQQDVSLAERLERELLRDSRPGIRHETVRQLAKWCNTNNPVYWDGMAVARDISVLLFGEVIDRNLLNA